MFASTFIFTLLLAFSLGSHKFVKYDKELEKAEYPKNITRTQTLNKFVEIVEKYKLNVSVIVSSGKNYEDGNLKEAWALSITLPVNGEPINKPTLSRDDFKHLAEVGNTEKITVAGSAATNNKLKCISNKQQAFPITLANKLLIGIRNGKTGLSWDEKDFVAQYTFHSVAANGKNQTTKIFHGDFSMEVVDKSENIKDKELAIIKKSVINGMLTSGESHAPKAISALLTKEFPDQTWDVAGPLRKNNQIDSKYWALLKFSWGDQYLVYSAFE